MRVQGSGFRVQVQGSGFRVQGAGFGKPALFRRGLVFKAHRNLYHSTLVSRVIKKEEKNLQDGGFGEHDTFGGVFALISEQVARVSAIGAIQTTGAILAKSWEGHARAGGALDF